MMSFERVIVVAWVSLLGLSAEGCRPRWRVSACAANADGQCARYAQHGAERRVVRGRLAQDFTERFTECAHGFARVDFEQQSDEVVQVRATCRVNDPERVGGVTMPDAAAATDASTGKWR